MAEYIEREAALEIVKRTSGDYATAFSEIAHYPAADVALVRHGRWIAYLDGDSIMPDRYYKCNRCGRTERIKEPYCHCGAKMDGGETNGTGT